MGSPTPPRRSSRRRTGRDRSAGAGRSKEREAEHKGRPHNPGLSCNKVALRFDSDDGVAPEFGTPSRNASPPLGEALPAANSSSNVHQSWGGKKRSEGAAQHISQRESESVFLGLYHGETRRPDMSKDRLVAMSNAILALTRYCPTIDKHGRWIAVGRLRLYPDNGAIFRVKGRTSTQLYVRGLDQFMRLAEAEHRPPQLAPTAFALGIDMDELEIARFMRHSEVFLNDDGSLTTLTARTRHAYIDTDHSSTRLAVLELARHGFDVRRCTGTHLKVGRLADIYPTTGRIYIAGKQSQRATLPEMIAILKDLFAKTRLRPVN
jgi:hypothetical protein